MSYRRDFSIYRKEEVLCQLKIRCAIEKFKNQPRPLVSQDMSLSVNIFEIYLVRQSL
jgi:hypothetical protein